MKALLAVAALLMAVSAQAQLRATESYAVAREHVAHAVATALTAHGVAVAEPQVWLLTDVMASEPAPSMEMQSAMWMSDGEDGRRVAVKMACRAANTCLPFYAVVEWPADAKLPGEMVEGVRARAVYRAVKVKAPVVLRAGERAMLLLDDGQVHLQVPVIALENASAGQTIRASSLDHKRSYTGQVIGPRQMKGAF